MVTEWKDLEMEISTKDNIKEVNSMARENMYGLMDLLTREISLRDADMGREIGNLQEVEVTFISGLMNLIKSVDMADIYGLMDALTKVNLELTSSKHMHNFRNGKGRLIYQDGK